MIQQIIKENTQVNSCKNLNQYKTVTRFSKKREEAIREKASIQMKINQ